MVLLFGQAHIVEIMQLQLEDDCFLPRSMNVNKENLYFDLGLLQMLFMPTIIVLRFDHLPN